MTKRLDYLDTAKGIGVILVLLGHLQGERFFAFSPYILPMCEWIFSFHMPLFFIISGILIHHKKEEEKDIKSIAKRRFKGIMIPYFWFSFFYMCVVIYALINKSVLPQALYINLWYVLSMYGMNVLWFLPTLFLAELLFILIIKKMNLKKSVIFISVISGVSLFLSYILTKLTYDSSLAERLHEICQIILRPLIASSFILTGYLGYIVINKIFTQEEKEKHSIIAVLSSRPGNLIAGLVLMIIAALSVRVNHGVDFRSLVFKNVFFYYLCALFSSFGLILICKAGIKAKILTFFGANSLVFMATHNSETILFLGLKLSMYVNQFITHARGYISYAVVVLVILIYVSVMIVIINNLFPFIIGKPFKSVFVKFYKKTDD